MENYTKGKWKLEEYGDLYITVNNKTIGHIYDYDNQKEGLANARRIVHCVNNFDDVVEACEAGVKFLDCLLAGNGMSEIQLRMLSENRMAFRRILEQALARAKGE